MQTKNEKYLSHPKIKGTKNENAPGGFSEMSDENLECVMGGKRAPTIKDLNDRVREENNGLGIMHMFLINSISTSTPENRVMTFDANGNPKQATVLDIIEMADTDS